MRTIFFAAFVFVASHVIARPVAVDSGTPASVQSSRDQSWSKPSQGLDPVFNRRSEDPPDLVRRDWKAGDSDREKAKMHRAQQAKSEKDLQASNAKRDRAMDRGNFDDAKIYDEDAKKHEQQMTDSEYHAAKHSRAARLHDEADEFEDKSKDDNAKVSRRKAPKPQSTRDEYFDYQEYKKENERLRASSEMHAKMAKERRTMAYAISPPSLAGPETVLQQSSAVGGFAGRVKSLFKKNS